MIHSKDLCCLFIFFFCRYTYVYFKLSSVFLQIILFWLVMPTFFVTVGAFYHVDE